MNDSVGIIEFLIALVATPFVLFKQVFFEIGNLIVFDFLQLGPYLPITL